MSSVLDYEELKLKYAHAIAEIDRLRAENEALKALLKSRDDELFTALAAKEK